MAKSMVEKLGEVAFKASLAGLESEEEGDEQIYFWERLPEESRVYWVRIAQAMVKYMQR